MKPGCGEEPKRMVSPVHELRHRKIDDREHEQGLFDKKRL
jgi:hypothetical protein